MKRIPLNKNYCLSIFDLIPVGEFKSLTYIGRCDGVGYRSFLKKAGLPYGEFKVPSDLKVGEEWHIGNKGDELCDRLRFKVVEFDGASLLLEILGKIPSGRDKNEVSQL